MKNKIFFFKKDLLLIKKVKGQILIGERPHLIEKQMVSLILNLYDRQIDY